MPGGVSIGMALPLPTLQRAVLIGAGFALLIPNLSAQEPRPESRREGSPRNGPWNNDLLLFTSADGKSFERVKTLVERGGVPCVTSDAKGRLIAVFQWFPFDRQEAFDRVASVVSEDQGVTWSKPAPIVMEGLPEGAQRPFDPTLVLLEDGKLRLYFTCTTRERREPGIYSAISEDGQKFRFEPGMRFGVEGEKVVDPAVTRLGKTWHLFSPMEPRHARDATLPGDAPKSEGPQPGARPPEEARGYHAVSDNGVTFRRVDDVAVPVRGSWIGNVLAQDDQLRFYGSGAGEGWLAESPDGVTWKLASTPLRVGGDPAVARLSDGKFLLISTSPPRADGQRPPFLPQPPSPQPENREPTPRRPGSRVL
jgi:hypothetical protein